MSRTSLFTLHSACAGRWLHALESPRQKVATPGSASKLWMVPARVPRCVDRDAHAKQQAAMPQPG
jgi:hypothetical protein